MSNFSEGWQDRALLYLHSKANISRNKTKLIFVRLCEYALEKNAWIDGNLTLNITVDEMEKVCNANRSSIITAMKTLTECGAITRVRDRENLVKSVTTINFKDE